MKINLDHISLNFENVDGTEERLKRISNLIWKLLEEKLERIDYDNDNNSSNNTKSFSSREMISNNITLDELVIPTIHVNSDRTEYEIASVCASALCQAIIMKLR